MTKYPPPTEPTLHRVRTILDLVYARQPVGDQFNLPAALSDLLQAMAGSLRAPGGEDSLRLAIRTRSEGGAFLEARSHAAEAPPHGEEIGRLLETDPRPAMHRNGIAVLPLDTEPGTRAVLCFYGASGSIGPWDEEDLLGDLARLLSPLVKSALLHEKHLVEIRRLRSVSDEGVLSRDITLRELSRIYAENVLARSATKMEVCRILGITDKTLNRILRGE